MKLCHGDQRENSLSWPREVWPELQEIFWGTGAVESCPSSRQQGMGSIQCERAPGQSLQSKLSAGPALEPKAAKHTPCLCKHCAIHLVFFTQISLFFAKKTFLISPHASPPQPLHESYLLSVIEKGWAGQASHSHFVQNPFCALLV